MSVEEELRVMINEMIARTGDRPMKIMCNRETLDQLWDQSGMIYASAADAENNTGYIARFSGVPIELSSHIETGKFFLLPDESQTRPIRVQFEDNADRPSSTRFMGVFSETDPRTIESGYSDGDIVLYEGKEYVWVTDKFVELRNSFTTTDTYSPVYDYGTGTQWWTRSPISSEPSFAGVDLGRTSTYDSYVRPNIDTIDFSVPRVTLDMPSPSIEYIEETIKKGRDLEKKRKKSVEEQVVIDEDKFLDILKRGDSKK